MSAQVETMMFAGQVPWHGLGTYVGDEPVTSAVALKESGLDWEVNKVPLKTVFETPITTHVAIERSTDSKVLGIVGSKYEPLQNRDAFSMLDSLVDGGDMRYHTAGSLRGGQRVWLLGKFGSQEVVKGDRVDEFVFLYNSHDGSSAVRAIPTTVRVVCANTVAMALSEARGRKINGLTVRHTTNMADRLSQAANILGFSREIASAEAEVNKFLASLSISNAKWNDFLNELVPNRGELEEGQYDTRRNNVRVELTDLFENGIGTDIEGVRGTAWGAFNAVTEYVNHHSTVKSHKDGLRFENVMFGTGADMMAKARKILVAA